MAAIFPACLASGFELPKWFPFNKQDSLDEWQERIFKNRVMYVVEPQVDGGFLAASSQEACSGLIYKVKFDVEENPMISWQWKVTKFPDKSKPLTIEEGWIEKDDYAARVYVIFSSWNFLSTKSLEYIWDEKEPVETIITSPYMGSIKLIVVESGTENLNNWVLEKRNIYKDFIKAFGEEPPKYATAIALMTDSDNTISSAEAFYKDIKVGFPDE